MAAWQGSGSDYQELLERIDLRALAEEAGARFERGGGRSSICPLHPGSDNGTAFHLYLGEEGTWRWHCFTRCPDGENDGDAIDFYRRWQRVDFVTALRELARRAGMEAGGDRRADPDEAPGERGAPAAPQVRPPGDRRPRPAVPRQPGPRRELVGPDRDPPPAAWQRRAAAFLNAARERLWSAGGVRALAYLEQARGLSHDTIRRWGLGVILEDAREPAEAWGLARDAGPWVWLSRGIVIPGCRGETVWYIKIRRPVGPEAAAAMAGPEPAAGAVAARYTSVRGGRATLYGAGTLRGKPFVLLTEGEFDALVTWQAAGDLVGVATLGGARQRLDRAAALDLQDRQRIFVAYDTDEAGEAGRRYFRRLGRKYVCVALPRRADGTGRAHDITDYWQSGGDVRAWVSRLIGRAQGPLTDSETSTFTL